LLLAEIGTDMTHLGELQERLFVANLPEGNRSISRSYGVPAYGHRQVATGSAKTAANETGEGWDGMPAV